MGETKKHYNRIHLFEFEDLSWFPNVIRKGMVDYLSFFLNKVDYYKQAAPLIKECLYKTQSQQMLDLCSGSGSPAIKAVQHINVSSNKTVSLTLSDKFPNAEASEHISENGKNVAYHLDPIDALDVPGGYKGVRTMFSALHHFKPEQVTQIIQKSVKKKAPIAFFDGGDKNLITILGIILVHPIIFLFCTPFLRPFRWSRLLFTYIIPLIPLCTIWDGSVSILRLYSPKDMLHLAKESDPNAEYVWKSGKTKHPLGFKMSYLIGWSKSE